MNNWQVNNQDLTGKHKDLTSQHKDLTSKHKDLNSQHKDLTCQHDYLTSGGRDMPPYMLEHKLYIKI